MKYSDVTGVLFLLTAPQRSAIMFVENSKSCEGFELSVHLEANLSRST